MRTRALKKTIAIIFLAVIMLFSVGVGLKLTVVEATTFTNSIFYTNGITLSNTESLTQGGKLGTLVSPTKNGAFFRIDRDLVGLTSIEFAIVNESANNDFVFSFENGSAGFDVSFVKEGSNYFATVKELGEQLGKAQISNAKDIILSFDANTKKVLVEGKEVCKVDSVLPSYKVFCNFNETDSNNEKLLIYSINEHSFAQATLTNKKGPALFADFSIKGSINNFYTLPQPYGCDLLDGKISNFEVEVKFNTQTIISKTNYQSGLGFIPVSAGSYQVTYFAKDSNGVEGSQTLELEVLSAKDYTETVFDFDSKLESIKLGVNSTMTIPFATVTNSSVSNDTYSVLLTIKKDGVALAKYNEVEISSLQKISFSEAGSYEFIYKASNVNIVGEKSFTVTVVSNLPSINIPNFKGYYLTNEKVELPSATMSYNGKSVKAQSIVNYPVSKKAVLAKSATLSENGLYTIEYRATIDGKMYVYNRTFIVAQSEYTTKGGSASYAESTLDDGIYGVLAKLSTGDSITFNEPIDLTGKKAGQEVLVVDILPTVFETTDFKQLNVRFTDIYDEDNYVTISCRRSRDESDQHMSYIKAGYKAQTQVGIESASGTAWYDPSDWGEYISCSFTGYPNHSFKVSFDYENRTIYANGKKIMALNNPIYFDELWDGFTTGECYVTISLQDLLAMDGNVLVRKVGDLDLSKTFIDDKEVPTITVDGDYESDKLPKAVVGTPYKVFDASAYDIACGECDVITSVYYAYTGSSRGQINLVNGEFTPFMSGRYTIEYKAIDNSGNVGIKTLTVYAYNSIEDMVVKLGEPISGTWLVGHEVEVATYDVEKTNGNVNVEIIAKNTTSKKEYKVEDYKFVPFETGEYEIIYTATDYIGRSVSDSYNLTVGTDGLAVFKGEAEMPFVFIKGASYTLPQLKAYEYIQGQEKEVAVKISVLDSNGSNEVTGKYAPSVSKSGDMVEITYKATTTSGDTIKTYKVPVQITKANREYDMTQYFIGSGFDVTADESNVIITTNTDAEVKYIMPLIANNFDFDFTVPVTKNSFNSIDVYVTDMFDSNVRVKFSYIKMGNGDAYMSINDGVSVKSASSFTNESNNKFVIRYDYEKLKLADNLGNGAKITSTVNGDKFNGFPSGRVYFEFAFNGVTSESQIKINSINSQRFSNSKIDSVRPQIVLTGVMGGSYTLGSTYTISSAYALDVLDYSVNFTLSVESPNGNEVVDTNGNTLTKVDPTVERKIVLTEFGNYKLTYSARDTSNRLYTFSSVVFVPDTVAPTITINGSVSKTASLNKKVALPSATAYKNGEELTKFNELTFKEESINVVVFVICPNTRREVATRNIDNGKYTYTFTQTGEHTVVYVVYDEIGNRAEQRFTVKVSK